MEAKDRVNFPVEASEHKRVFQILIKANVELVLIGIYQIWTGEGRRNSLEKIEQFNESSSFFFFFFSVKRIFFEFVLQCYPILLPENI